MDLATLKPYGDKQVITEILCPDNFSMKNVPVDKEAVCRIHGSYKSRGCEGKWLDDMGVNATLAVLLQAANDVCGKDTIVFSTYFYERISGDPQAGYVMAKKVDRKGTRKWLIPINIASHWILAVINFQKKCITIVDSLHIHYAAVVAKLKLLVENVHGHTEWCLWEEINDKHSIPQTIPLQANSYDCGVLMLKAVQNELMENKRPFSIFKNETQLYRHEFLCYLQASPISKLRIEFSAASEKMCSEAYSLLKQHHHKASDPTKAARNGWATHKKLKLRRKKPQGQLPNQPMKNLLPIHSLKPPSLPIPTSLQPAMSSLTEPPLSLSYPLSPLSSEPPSSLSDPPLPQPLPSEPPSLPPEPPSSLSDPPLPLLPPSEPSSSLSDHPSPLPLPSEPLVSQLEPSSSLSDPPLSLPLPSEPPVSQSKPSSSLSDPPSPLPLPPEPPSSLSDPPSPLQSEFSSSLSDPFSPRPSEPPSPLSESPSLLPLPPTPSQTSEPSSLLLKSSQLVSANQQTLTVLKGKELPCSLKDVIPTDDQYTYVIEKFTKMHGEEHKFLVHLRINISEESVLREWLQKMFELSKCTYRVTRTYKLAQKRVLFRVDMHCQHIRKDLTVRQKGQKALSKKKPNPLMGNLRNKKTDCPSTLLVKIIQPTKKELYSKEKEIFKSHKTKLELLFSHNHPLHSAHALSFRPVSSETKDKYHKLFQSGHSAASARHYYETTLMNSCEDDELQTKLSDRSINPLLQDVSRLYDKWRLSEYGTSSDGKSLADSLIEEIAMYNKNNTTTGGKASVQVYEADPGSTDEDSEAEFKPTKPKKKKSFKKSSAQPLIIAACTPLMSRVHKNTMQAGEMVFCDSTSCLEKYNCSLFVLSTSSSAGGLPLGVGITSDEKQPTVKKALESLLDVLPDGSFYGHKEGPQLVMTDDSSTLREAISQVWPKARLLLCHFHFLQRRWTWLFDSKNKIKHDHRSLLINKIKELVYCRTESDLTEAYSKFVNDATVAAYKNFKDHMAIQWSKRHEWAECYRNDLITRGNNTNNISEAGIRIIKELIFGRIKAYNLIQMFQFVTDALEVYIQRKLLSIAHNRFNHFISIKYRGLLAEKIDKSSISVSNKSKREFIVKSSNSTSNYVVDMEIGTCSCDKGRNGSPCSHQAAVIYHYQTESLNFVPTLHPSLRQKVAFLALGEKARADTQFYSSLHDWTAPNTDINSANPENTASDFTGTAWDLVRAGALDDNSSDSDTTKDILDLSQKKDLQGKIASMATILSNHLDSNGNDPQLIPGIEKFLTRFHDLSSLGSTARLASALHCFGSESRRSSSLTSGCRRWGKRIGVQATASGRRKYGSRGKAQVIAGRPRTSYVKKGAPNKKNHQFTIPTRRKNQVDKKRAHNLSLNISFGKQNAGKW